MHSLILSRLYPVLVTMVSGQVGVSYSHDNWCLARARLAAATMLGWNLMNTSPCSRDSSLRN